MHVLEQVLLAEQVRRVCIQFDSLPKVGVKIHQVLHCVRHTKALGQLVEDRLFLREFPAPARIPGGDNGQL